MDQDGAALHSDDLEWARGLAAGERDALARYEDELVPMIRTQLRKRGHTDDQIEDIQQTLRARLLVGDGDGPAVASYEGRGKLRSWVLVAALREAVRMREKGAREPAVDDDALIAIADRGDQSSDAPEKARYREAFKAAFRTALANLGPKERNLLRLHVLDELSVDEIAGLHGVHRATAARWVEAARDSVSLATKRELARALGIDPFEASELMDWVKSRIELSLSGLAKP